MSYPTVFLDVSANGELLGRIRIEVAVIQHSSYRILMKITVIFSNLAFREYCFKNCG